MLKIEEDLDFGCEERRPGQPVMAVVTLRSESGQEITKKIPDQLLYDKNINEGDYVFLDEKQNIADNTENITLK